MKLWRWTHLILAVTVLLHTALTFEDHDSKMYRAIIDVQRQLKLLKGSSVLPELIDKGKTKRHHNIFVIMQLLPIDLICSIRLHH